MRSEMRQIGDAKAQADTAGQVFVPFSEPLVAAVGALGELVPFQLEYKCVRLLDGTYDFSPDLTPALQSS